MINDKITDARELFGTNEMDDFSVLLETLKKAVLSTNKDVRDEAARDLYEESGRYVTRGFAMGGKLYLEIELSAGKTKTFCFGDMPKEYEGVTRPGAHSFDTREL
jgi:hypothetical protein